MSVNKQITLRAYAEKEGSHWVAVCIDLSLAAQADSSSEAIKKLESMMHSYVDEALNLHNDYTSQLLSRKAPLSQRLTYYKILFLCKVYSLFKKNNHKNNGNGRAFSEHYPTQVA
jgi:hypothetical protein